ncbi:MAG: hybrid sensor histidine kinase/response regulator [Salibacteraceae bacterium]
MAEAPSSYCFILISDQSSLADEMAELLKEIGYPKGTLVPITSTQLDLISKHHPEILIIDDRLSGMNNLEMLEVTIERFPNVAKLMLTRQSDRKVAVDAMKRGATDYVFKRDLNGDFFKRTLLHCIEYSEHQELLQRRNAIIDALFDEAEEAIFLAEPDGSLVLFNQVFAGLFKNKDSEEENFNRFIKQYLTEGSLNDLLDQKGSYSIVIKSKEEEVTKHYRVNIKRIRLNDHFERILGMISDITSQVMAEQEHMKGEKLELTARMAQILAHEVRNPLTNIRLSADYLEDELYDNEEYKAYTEIIDRNVKRIDSLIGHMLRSVKPFEINPKREDVEMFFKNVLEQINDRKELLNATVNFTIHSKSIQWVFDSEKLELALLNLLSNSFEAMMNVEKPVILIDIRKQKDELLIQIEDNGNGMNQETVDKLFDAFYTGRKGGMGLGMTMVKNIVDGHNGSITVESEEDKGSKFMILLPKL